MSGTADWIGRAFAAARLRRNQLVPPPRMVVTKPSVSMLRRESQQRLCPDCNGSGYASTIDGRTLGTCQTCDGNGAPMSDDEWECRCGQRTASDADTIRDHIADAHAHPAGPVPPCSKEHR